MRPLRSLEATENKNEIESLRVTVPVYRSRIQDAAFRKAYNLEPGSLRRLSRKYS